MTRGGSELGKGDKPAVGFLLLTGKQWGGRELFCHLLLVPHAESLITISAPRARATFLSVDNDTRSSFPPPGARWPSP